MDLYDQSRITSKSVVGKFNKCQLAQKAITRAKGDEILAAEIQYLLLACFLWLMQFRLYLLLFQLIESLVLDDNRLFKIK